MVAVPENTSVISPSNTPIAPERTSSLKSIPAPIENPTNGIISFSPGAKKARAILDELPRIKPRMIGKIAAKRVWTGKSASPAAPSAIIVKNGPSLIDKIEIEPLSVVEPNCEVRATKSEPLEFDIAAMTANGRSPQSVPSGVKKATATPTKAATPNLDNRRTIPFSTEGSAVLKLI